MGKWYKDIMHLFLRFLILLRLGVQVIRRNYAMRSTIWLMKVLILVLTSVCGVQMMPIELWMNMRMSTPNY